MSLDNDKHPSCQHLLALIIRARTNIQPAEQGWDEEDKEMRVYK